MLIPFYTGQELIDAFWLKPEQVHVERIAATLAKVNRFGGRTPYPYSVAQHAVFVSHLVPGPWRLRACTMTTPSHIWAMSSTRSSAYCRCTSGWKSACTSARSRPRSAFRARKAPSSSWPTRPLCTWRRSSSWGEKTCHSRRRSQSGDVYETCYGPCTGLELRTRTWRGTGSFMAWRNSR